MGATMLSITTDYAADTGCPEPYLRRIAEAGFSHVHWGHQWTGDFLYGAPEIRQIKAWLGELGLKLLDLHASVGPEKNYGSLREYERQAGVELVKNRLEMTAELGADVAILHLPGMHDKLDNAPDVWEQLWRSFDELAPVIRSTGVRIAIENGPIRHIANICDRYPPEAFGMCYDCGHGNMGHLNTEGGLDELEPLKDRLISVHLHDNDGSGDQHKVPFTGTVDWDRLVGILAESSYTKCVSMESSVGDGFDDEIAFLQAAFDAGTRLAAMIDKRRGQTAQPASAPG
ncbi:MAG TPA: sugar phosphate isomerase/epimerase [Phycisphaerae bacterium]|nr:sugar phosphate isomerase/epimerase [Phycisphaerae bacterium]HDZ45344.1 sugar phosphate isomerase/epimerase [Phycisphaerae bacterium]